MPSVAAYRAYGQRTRGVEICAIVDSYSQAVDEFAAEPTGHESDARTRKAKGQREVRGLTWQVPAQIKAAGK